VRRQALHLARRFAGSLSRAAPAPAEEAWAERVLLPGERGLWRRMSRADRRHALGVARRVESSALGRPGEQEDTGVQRAVLAAALLHDVGKLDADLGTFGRVGATLAGTFGGLRRARRWEELGGWRGRAGRYLRHDHRGAAMLGAAGSDPLVVSWAREHHQRPGTWGLPAAVAVALKEADDD
jgi:hypothetical protein